MKIQKIQKAVDTNLALGLGNRLHDAGDLTKRSIGLNESDEGLDILLQDAEIRQTVEQLLFFVLGRLCLIDDGDDVVVELVGYPTMHQDGSNQGSVIDT